MYGDVGDKWAECRLLSLLLCGRQPYYKVHFAFKTAHLIEVLIKILQRGELMDFRV